MQTIVLSGQDRLNVRWRHNPVPPDFQPGLFAEDSQNQMREPSTADWNALNGLAERVGAPVERVSMARRRYESLNSVPASEDAVARPGNPYVLLAGRSHTGMDALLSRWISPDAARALKQANGQVLVIGPHPERVQPRLGGWAVHKSNKLPPDIGHLIVLQSEARPSAEVLAQIATLGFVDQCVLVTRLNMALHTNERDLAAALAPLVATARVLMVGVTGDELTDEDMAELSSYAAAQMRQQGFGGRFGGSAIWYAGGAPPPGTLDMEGLHEFLAVEDRLVQAGRRQVALHIVSSLFRDLRRAADSDGGPNGSRFGHSIVSKEEIDELANQFAGYLVDLRTDLWDRVKDAPSASTDQVRSRALDALHGWEAYITPPGFWLERVEHLRPGMQSAILEEAQHSIESVRYDPGNLALVVEQRGRRSPFWLRGQLAREAARAGVGLALGVAATVAINLTLGSLPSPLPVIISVIALSIALVLGYSASENLFRPPLESLPRPADPIALTDPRPASVQGWPDFEQHMVAWFRTRMTAEALPPADELDRLAGAFELATLREEAKR